MIKKMEIFVKYYNLFKEKRRKNPEVINISKKLSLMKLNQYWYTPKPFYGVRL